MTANGFSKDGKTPSTRQNPFASGPSKQAAPTKRKSVKKPHPRASVAQSSQQGKFPFKQSKITDSTDTRRPVDAPLQNERAQVAPSRQNQRRASAEKQAAPYREQRPADRKEAKPFPSDRALHPQEKRAQVYRAQMNQPQEGRVQTDRPQAGRPQASRPQEGRVQADRPQAGRVYPGRIQDNQVQADRVYADRPQVDRPQMNRAQADGKRGASAQRPSAGSQRRDAHQSQGNRANNAREAQEAFDGRRGKHAAPPKQTAQPQNPLESLLRKAPKQIPFQALLRNAPLQGLLQALPRNLQKRRLPRAALPAAVAACLAVTFVFIASNTLINSNEASAEGIAGLVTEKIENIPNPNLSPDELSMKEKLYGNSENLTMHQVDTIKNQVEIEALEAEIAEKAEAGEPCDAKVCYLTFDDGPSGEVTPQILETLKQEKIPATFFVIGATDYFETVKDEERAGAVVALHTKSHKYDTIYSGTGEYFSDLSAIQEAAAEQLGHETKVMRFPGGSSNTIASKYSSGIMAELPSLVQDKGFQYFDWNVSSGDAGGNGIAAADLVANVVNGSEGHNRICVLMHDSDAKTTTAEALPEIIHQLKERGFRFGVLTTDTKAGGFQH